MAVVTGYPSEDKEDRYIVEPATVNRAGEFLYGLDTIGHNYVLLVDTDDVDPGSTESILQAAATLAKAGDIIRFISGPNLGREVVVKSVLNDEITLSQKLKEAPNTGDLYEIFRYQTPRVDSEGGVIVSGVSDLTRDSTFYNVQELCILEQILVEIKLMRKHMESITGGEL